MKNFTVENGFWTLFPEAQINVLVLKGIDNSVQEEQTNYFYGLLAEGKAHAKQFLSEDVFSENQVIQEWRQAFSKFKTKKGARSSIEALLKRASQDREFAPINPLVDIYNSISLKYAVPCGGEDLEKISEGLYLGKAQGGESFYPLGADSDAPALPDEIIYYDSKGAVCRCLNWREAQRTMLQEETKNAVLVVEAINSEQAKRADKAIAELKELSEAYFKTTGETYCVTAASPSITLG